MPNLLIIEPNLGSPGHWQSMVDRIGRHAASRGWSATCMGGPAAASTSEHLRVLRTIADAPRGWLGPNASVADLSDIRTSNDRLYDELCANDRCVADAADLVIVPAATVWNVLGIARWLAPHAARVVLQLLVPDFIDLSTDETDGRVDIYRQAIDLLLASDSPSPLIWTESPHLGERLAGALDSQVSTDRAPLLTAVDVDVESDQSRAETPNRPKLIGKLGRQHPDTGLYLLPSVVKGVLRRRRARARFLIQCAPYDWQQGAGQGPALAKVERLGRSRRVDLVTEQLDADAWSTALAKLDIAFLPYAPRFRYQSSGVFRESLALGIVTVVPRGSSMEADARSFDAGFVVFEPESVRSMIRALERAAGSPELALQARTAAKGFRQATDPQACFDTLLGSAG